MDMIETYDHDRAWTLRNRASLLSNRNLLLWYEQLYRRAFEPCGDVNALKVLEIGSGASPLKIFYDRVITSDILELEHLDLVFDCHHIDKTPHFEDASLDIITMTNVLHHLRDPVDFLLKTRDKLKPGGWVVAIEPYFSWLSSIIYRLLHHEPADFSVTEPRLADVKGPLSTANQALPQMIFMEKRGWHEPLLQAFTFDPENFHYFSSLAYMATGGISRRLPIPTAVYRSMLALDVRLADRFPSLLAAFFIICLQKKEANPL